MSDRVEGAVLGDVGDGVESRVVGLSGVGSGLERGVVRPDPNSRSGDSPASRDSSSGASVPRLALPPTRTRNLVAVFGSLLK
jgi:hypothetical protein